MMESTPEIVNLFKIGSGIGRSLDYLIISV